METFLNLSPPRDPLRCQEPQGSLGDGLQACTHIFLFPSICGSKAAMTTGIAHLLPQFPRLGDVPLSLQSRLEEQM